VELVQKSLRTPDPHIKTNLVAGKIFSKGGNSGFYRWWLKAFFKRANNGQIFLLQTRN